MMRRILIAALLGASLILAAGCAVESGGYAVGGSVTARPNGASDYSLFYDGLEPYGRWFDYGTYGSCWTPYDVPFGWRPYSVGHWLYTDDGWTWASDEPWGWATYHYGRWSFDDDYGWIWIPDRVWAPAWVAWRVSDDWVGWAPLPPGAVWQAGAGVQWQDDFDRQLGTQGWCFVPARSVLDVQLSDRMVPVPRNRTLLDRTRISVRFESAGGRPSNVGLDATVVEHAIGRPLPHYRIKDENRPWRGGPVGQDVPVFRPEVTPVPRSAPRLVEEPPRDPRADERLRAQHDAEQRRLEDQYAAERRRLESDQRREDVQNARGGPPDDMKQRHADEIKALDEQRDRARHTLESRFAKKFTKPEHGPKRERGGQGDRGQ